MRSVITAMTSVPAPSPLVLTSHHVPLDLPSIGRGVAARVLDSRVLLGQQREILIQHGHETYRLRLTRQNKLILTK